MRRIPAAGADGTPHLEWPCPLQLVPVGEVRSELATWLALELAARLGVRFTVGAPLELRSDWLDATRDQYRSDLIVDELIDRADADFAAEGERWYLAVAEVDLFAPGRTFVFGEATVGGCCAVIGLARLQGAGSRGSAIFHTRTVKEAVHELGHVAGLPHCGDPACVMFPSFDLEETDHKSSGFCPVCQCELARLFGIIKGLDSARPAG